jgi:hypothetical protein
MNIEGRKIGIFRKGIGIFETKLELKCDPSFLPPPYFRNVKGRNIE